MSQLTIWTSKLATSFLVLSGGLLVLGSSNASADTITLNSGAKVEGMIIMEDDDIIHFMNADKVVLRFNKSKVSNIVREDGPLTFETKGDEAKNNKRYEEALLHYDSALALGGDKEAIERKIDQVENLIIDEQLGGLSYDMREAKRLLKEKKFEAAEMTLREIADKAKGNQEIIQIASDVMGDVCVARARSYMNNVQHSSAEQEYLRALRFDSDNPAIYEELGDLYARRSLTHDKAVHNYLKALEFGSRKLSTNEINKLNLSIANIYFDNDYFESAARHYREVYQNDPNYSRIVVNRLIESLTNLANTRDLTNRQSTIEALREAIEIVPDNVDVQELLADLLKLDEEYALAIGHYERAIELAPRRPDLNEKLAQIYRIERKADKESMYLEREVEIDPDDYDSRVYYGDVLWKIGEYDKAVEQYEEAKELDPANPRALVALASSERKLGNYAEARRAIQEILDTYKNDIRAHLEMGLNYLDEKNYEKARPYFTDTIDLVNEDPQFMNSLDGNEVLANAYVGRGEVALNTSGPATATNDFNEALKLIENYPPAIFSIGEAFQKKYSSSNALQDLYEAELQMKKAIEMDENSAEFVLGLGQLYHKTLAQEDKGKETYYYSKALERYQQYLDMGGAQFTQVEGFIKEIGEQETALESTTDESEELMDTPSDSAEAETTNPEAMDAEATDGDNTEMEATISDEPVEETPEGGIAEEA